MRRMKRRGALVLSLLAALMPALTISEVISWKTETVFADQEEDEFEKYLSDQGFPESYKPLLRELHALHPNWKFEAFQTGLDWNYVIDNEMVQTRNLIPTYSSYASSLFDTELPGSFDWVNNTWTVFSAPNWVQVSRQCLEYFIDPRNWINEKNIFMFERLTFSEDTQTIEGVEKILKGTFMENAYIDASVASKTYFETENLTCNNGYLAGMEPGTTVNELLKKISSNDSVNIEVVGKDNQEKKTEDFLGTGDRLVIKNADNLEILSEYTLVIFGDINGDGNIDAIDRAYVKGYVYGVTKLSELQKIAADINQDNIIDAIDRAYLKGYVYGVTKINQVFKKNDGFDSRDNDKITYAQAFYNIGKSLNVSPYHLAARVRQEQGVSGNSPLISGTVEGYEGYYNYFNILANGVTAEEIISNGLKEAVAKEWNSRYKALEGGAEILASKHISKGQDTMYLQKFDVEGTYYSYFWHQYMQNVAAPLSESTSTYNTYAGLGALDCSYTFKIPVYENMTEICEKPTKTGNPNTRLSSLIIEGYEFAFYYNTFEYEIDVPKDETWITISATAYAQTTSIYGNGTWAITEDTDTLTIITTAENGDTLTYIVRMNRT